MSVHAYTSFSFSYLNRARVWARSIRRRHPDWILWCVITDKEPPGFTFNLNDEPFDHCLYVQDLFGDTTESWLFKHDVIEACTAVKGRALQHIQAQQDVRVIFYFDPDTAVFNDLTHIVEFLDGASIVLTPHQLEHEPSADRQAIIDNEIGSLKWGSFNLGFIAVANDSEGRRFAAWWADRLYDWCYDRTDIGVFVDQKWCDLVPCLFDRVKILRDPGCNVASWNLSQRELKFDSSGTMCVNGVPLRFFHFTKMGPTGDAMTRRYAKDNIEVYELWATYRRWIEECTDHSVPSRYWHYGVYDDGTVIAKSARLRYRECIDKGELILNPFSVENKFRFEG